MKNKKIWLGILVIALVFGMLVVGCDNGSASDISYTVIYEGNGGIGFMEHSVHTYGEEKKLNANGFIKEGFDFAGWATESTGSVKYMDEQNVKNLTKKDGDTITLYAIWGYSYTVTYDANGGNGNMANSIFITNKPQALSGNLFTKTGYTFSGWAKSPDGQIVYKNEQIVLNLTSNAGETVALFAIWQVNTYTVSYNSNGGSGNMENSSFTYNIQQNLRANTFTRANHEFVGWAKTDNGQAEFANEASVINLTLTSGGTVVLYARWAKISHSELLVTNAGTNPLFDLTSDTIQPNLDIPALKQAGYTRLKFDVSFTFRTSPGSIGTAKLKLNLTGIREQEYPSSTSWANGTFTYTASIDSTGSDNGDFKILWQSVSLLATQCQIGERTITITALK